MKKIILSISIAAIAIAGFMYEPASENQTSTGLTVDNAEALAGPTVHMVGCWYDGGCTAGAHINHYYKGWLLVGDQLIAQ